jgi:hypothetical protein
MPEFFRGGLLLKKAVEVKVFVLGTKLFDSQGRPCTKKGRGVAQKRCLFPFLQAEMVQVLFEGSPRQLGGRS